MASTMTALHQEELGATGKNETGQSKKLALALALGAAVGMLGFFVMQPHGATDGIISFDLDCIKDRVGAHNDNLDMVADCEITSHGKALGKLAMPGGQRSMTRHQATLAAAGAAAAAVLTPQFPAVADGASSKATRERARALYGSRVYRLQGAAGPQILAAADTFDLFITGAYQPGNFNGETIDKLNALAKQTLVAAKKGDDKAANSALSDFIKVGKITELDQNSLNQYNPLERRSMGSPPNAAVLEETPKAGKGKVLGSVTSVKK